MNQKERSVYFYWIQVEVKNSLGIRGIKPPPMSAVLAHIKKMVEENKARRRREEAGEIVYVPAIDIDTGRNVATILMNISNRNESDVIYSNPDIGERDVFRKREGQGNEYSSHIIINLKSDEKDPSKYQMLVEHAPKLTGGTIAKHLSFLIKECSYLYRDEFVIPHPDGSVENGKPKTLKTWLSFTHFGMLSDTFKAQLENGHITDIELVTERVSISFEQGACAIPRRQTISMRPADEDRLGSRLKSIFKTAKEHNYERARIVFKTADGVDQSASFDTDTESVIAEERHVRRKTISGFALPLDDSTLGIDNERKSKMVELLAI